MVLPARSFVNELSTASAKSVIMTSVMMFLGLFTVVVLPLFLLVSARVLAAGEHAGEPLTRFGVVVLYIFTAISAVSGLVLVFDLV